MSEIDDNDITFIERFLHSFKVLGGNEFGFIDYDLFKSVLYEKNEVEAKEIVGIIDKENHIKDNKLNFVSLCFSILSTKTCFNRISRENGRIMNCTGINSDTFPLSKGSNHAPSLECSDVLSSSERLCSKFLRGVIFEHSQDFLSYRYSLDVLENVKIEIQVKGLSIQGESIAEIPVELLMFQDGKSKTFVAASIARNENGYCCIKSTLRRGKYILVPILLKPFDYPSSDKEEDIGLESLISIDDSSNILMTDGCERALRTVFDLIDIDGNGLVNQSEFDQFIQYTTGEPATDEWSTIEDNFTMDNSELTFEGFLELYKMVLQTDPYDVIKMFEKMGLNSSLQPEKAQPFLIVAKAETGQFILESLPVASYVDVSDKVVRKMATELGSSSKVKNMNDLLLFSHSLPHRNTLVIQNQSHGKIAVRLDCRRSTNCESHRGNLDCIIDVLPRTSMVGHHLFPIDPTQKWSVECNEQLK